MKELTHFSLCSGIGGLDLAAEWAGFKTIAQCEIDDYASKVLSKNFKGVPNLHDIRTITNAGLAKYGIDAEEITVISAGFPCQPYSLAGKGKGDSDSRDLWGEVARVLGEIRPHWFVGENTPGLFARQNQRFFRRVLDDLTALGYSVGWGIWGACDVGAPHKRERVFFMAHADGGRREKNDTFEPSAGKTLDEEGGANKFGGANRLQSNVSNTASDIMGVFGSESETQSTRIMRNYNGNGTQRNASGEWWETEPFVGRVVNELPHRVDRLRCLGNAVVPAQAYPIFKAIADYYKGVLK